MIKAVGFPIRGFVGAVQPFDHLFVWSEFFGDNVGVRKPDHLCNVEPEGIAELVEELLGSKGIGTVAIRNKAEIFGEFLQVPESHAHCHDAGANAPVIRDPVTNDGAPDSVHNEPDISLDAPDFDVCFIGGKGTSGMVVVVVHKGLDADCGSLAVVGNLLVGDLDVIQVFECLGGLSEREAKVNMKGQAQRHDMGIKFTEFEGRGIFRE